MRSVKVLGLGLCVVVVGLAGGVVARVPGASANLSITKTDGVTAVDPGGPVTYTIMAANAGPNPTTATVADTFPAALGSCSWTCSGAGGGTCSASGSGNINDSISLPNGASVTYTASCTLSALATGTLSNTATVTSTGATDPDLTNNTASDTDVVQDAADLSVTKTDGVTSVTAGGSTTYTIVASNAGPTSSGLTTLSDAFPASLTCTWTCVGGSGGACTVPSGAGSFVQLIGLPPGGTVTVVASCAVSPSATGTIVNTAVVGGTASDPVPGNNSASDTDTVTAAVPVAPIPVLWTLALLLAGAGIVMLRRRAPPFRGI